MMKKAVIYIHGKGGNAAEAEHYEPLFNGCDVMGFDYKSETPWEAKEEFPVFFDEIKRIYSSVILIANSIGAFFSMISLSGKSIEKAYFISPVVNMEKLISDMMMWAGVTEDELREKREIVTDFGETLSWKYLSFVRENPIEWNVSTHIIYGENDNLTSLEAVTDFAEKAGASLAVMKGGEHWFHTEEQMNFIDCQIKSKEKNKKLSEMTLSELWELFPIILTEHKDEWKSDYTETEKYLKENLRGLDIVRISHIGSTAVEGIWAKPIIDILVEISEDENIYEAAKQIEKLGFIKMSESEKRISFNKGYTENGFAEKVYHIHLRFEGDNDEIYFCDYLNKNPHIAKEYERLKLSLQKRFEHDRDGYTDAKTDFIRKYTEEAKKHDYRN